MRITVNSDRTLNEAISALCQQYREHSYMEVEIAVGERQRSDQQRKAIEVYCNMLAKALNAAGMDQRAVLAQMREGVEIPWSQDRVKDTLWREVQKAMLDKTSTRNLSRQEVSQVYEALNRWTGTTLGVSVPFPERREAA